MKAKTKIKSEPTVSYLLFSVGEDRFAIDAQNVRRIAKWIAPIEMPGAGHENISVVEVENEISVMFRIEDLLPQKPSNFNYLILTIHPQANVAVSATNVFDLSAIPESAIKNTPQVIKNPYNYRVFEKSFVDDKGIVVILDVRQLKL
jgi:chemotaxis signal transduction protein